MFSGPAFTILALAWSFLILSVDLYGGLLMLDQWQSPDFSATMGKVTQSRLVASHSSRHGTSYSAKIEISYAAAGRTFRSNDFRFRDRDPHQTIAAHPVGSNIEVYYDPVNPARAVLRRGVDGGDFCMALIFLTMNCSMLATVLVPLSKLREVLRQPLAGGVVLVMDGAVTRARLGVLSVPLLSLIGSGATSMLICLVLNVLFGSYPPPALVASAWGMVAASALVFPWWVLRSDSGKRDVLINPVKQRLALPLHAAEESRIEVPWAQIARTAVRYIKSSYKGRSRQSCYAEIQLKDGSIHRLAQFYLPWRARGFTRWLAEQVGLPSGSAVCEYGRADHTVKPEPALNSMGIGTFRLSAR